MIQKHYSAFISYKHAEKDNRVAEEVQRRIERFHIPRAVRKKTGKEKLDPVFRDKAELPITADLNEEIQYALENSDYLIVICSHSTKLSNWVPREIETFLKNHTKKQIFTVLVEGEPYEVIPKELTVGERTIYYPDGTSETVEASIEPLSCDYRMPFKKAAKEELPRLMAGLIGCHYDELIMREQRYRMHRMMALGLGVLTIAAGAIGYLLWSRTVIQTHLTREQRSNSINLAQESQRLLEEGDRTQAIKLALSALPSETEDKPVTTEASYALTQAIGAYVSPSNYELEPVWTYEAPEEVRLMRYDEERLIVADTLEQVTAWNTETHEQVFFKAYGSSMGESVKEIYVYPDHKACIVTSRIVEAVDLENGDILWTFSQESDMDMLSGSAISHAKDVMVILENNYDRPAIALIDLMTGTITQRIFLDEEEYHDASVGHVCFSEDDDKILLEIKKEGNGRNVVIEEADRTAGTWKVLLENTESWVQALSYMSNGWICLCFSDRTYAYSYGYNGDGKYYGTVTSVQAWDPEKETWAWGRKIRTLGKEVKPELNAVHVTTINGSEMDMVEMIQDNRLLLLTEDKGTVYSDRSLPSGVVYHDILDFDTSYFNLILANGLFAGDYFAETDTLSAFSDLGDQVRMAAHSWDPYTDTDYVFILRQTDRNTIYYYRSGISDQDYTPVEEEVLAPDTFLTMDYKVLGPYVATIRSRYNSLEQISYFTLYLYDEKDLACKHVIELGTSEQMGKAKILRLDEASSSLYLAFSSETFQGNLLKVDLKEDTVSQVTETSLNMNQLAWSDDAVFSMDHNGHILWRRAFDGDEEQEYVCLDETDFQHSPWHMTVSKDGSMAAVVLGTMNSESSCLLRLLNVKEERWIELSEEVFSQNEDISAEILSAWDEKAEHLALSAAGRLILIGSDGQVLNNTSTGGRQIIGLTFCNEQLIIVYRNGTVERYDPADGSLLGTFDLEMEYNSLYGEHDDSLDEKSKAEFFCDDDRLMILIRGAKDTMYTIHTDDWKQEARVRNCFLYSPETDRYYIHASYSGSLGFGYFHRYSLDELIEKGHRILEE